jgi:ABC-type cobalamin/Fe3+-siderophores transport system ATPase subunit
MRLISLYIEDYKNIKKQTFDFSSNTGYIALIGLNGSGKSNLLEAISLIFNDLYGIPHTEQVKGYTITYELGGVPYTYSTLDEHNNVVPLNKGDKICPSSIIACYSGEDLRLWDMAYENYYMQYFKGAIKDKSFSPKIMYINKYCWKIAFISLLCSTKDVVKDFLKNNLLINDIKSVDMHFEADEKKREKFSNHAACRWYDYIKRLQDEDENHLVNANIIATTDMTSYGASNRYVPNYVFQFLYLLSLPKKNQQKKQTIDKLITDIKIYVNDIDFDNLSEGEKKMILIECISQVLGDDNSLVLLDEPDAHVHIDNKKKLLESITSFEGQTILSTHSPIFTNLMVNDNIYPIENGRAISVQHRDLIVKMANNNINYIDGACLIASKYLVITEGPGDINYIAAAIQACGKDEAQYKVLEKVSFVYTGGAKLVETFNDEILSGLYDTLERIVFVFDLDSEGREGAKQAQKLIDEGKDKIKIVFYNNNYPIVDPNNNEFYLEDIFLRSTYKIVQLPNIGGEPTYAQLKKCSTLASSIKSKIAELYKKKLLKEEDYYSFKPFLFQLKSVLGL